MNIKTIISEWLREHGFDGLCDPKHRCGCLVDDLAPCYICVNVLDCQPGHRDDIDENEDCVCDGQGEAHYHIVPPLPKQGKEK